VAPVRLTDEEVAELRQKYEEGARQIDLAAEYGISQNTVSSLVTGRSRIKAGGPIVHGGARKLATDDVLAIREAYDRGANSGALALQFGVSQQMISNIVSGRAFSDIGGPRRKAPLTVDEVQEIKVRFEEGENRSQLAAAFGVSLPTIYSVMRSDIPGVQETADLNITRDRVIEIRHLYLDGVPQADIAGRFGVSQAMISEVVRGNMYGWLPGPIAGPARRDLTHDQVLRIREAFAVDVSIDQLADQYSADPSIIRQVVIGVTYPGVGGPVFPLA